MKGSKITRLKGKESESSINLSSPVHLPDSSSTALLIVLRCSVSPPESCLSREEGKENGESVQVNLGSGAGLCTVA